MSCKCGHLANLSRRRCLCKQFLCKCRNWALNSNKICSVCAKLDEDVQQTKNCDLKNYPLTNPDIEIIGCNIESTSEETESGSKIEIRTDIGEDLKNVNPLTGEIESLKNDMHSLIYEIKSMKNYFNSLTSEIESTVKELNEKLNGSSMFVNMLSTDSAQSQEKAVEALDDICKMLMNKIQDLSRKSKLVTVRRKIKVKLE